MEPVARSVEVWPGTYTDLDSMRGPAWLFGWGLTVGLCWTKPLTG
jgi:hypothetical protein